MSCCRMHVVIALAIAILAAGATAEAHVVRIDIDRVEAAFGGAPFGDAGSYERVTGHAVGEVDPKVPENAIIQDIELAPLNARGMVEYSTDIDILRPTDPKHGNDVLLFNVVNRGNKGALSLFNMDVPTGLAGSNALLKSWRRLAAATGLHDHLVRLAG